MTTENHGSDWGAVDLDTIPSVSLGVLGLGVLFHLLLSIFAVVVVFAHPPPEQPIVGDIWIATGGIISAQLLVNLFMLVSIVGGLLWVDDHLEPGHVGLVVEAIPMGVVVTVGLWLGIQAIGIGLDVVGGGVGVSTAWTGIGAGGWITRLIPELFGSALQEEVFFRGLLLTQAYLISRRYLGGTRVPLAVAVVGTQAWFGLVHLPIGLVQGTTLPLPADLVGTALLGIIYALVYLRTGNLFVAVGVHALANDPAPIFVDPVTARFVLLGLTVLLLLGWPIIRRGGRDGRGEV